MRRSLGLVGTVCLLAALGCGPLERRAHFTASLDWQPCPSKVEITFLSDHECGYLTVLEDRTKPAGRTVRLLVAKVPPTGTSSREGIGTSFGDNVGDPKALGGDMAAGATRMQWIFINVEQRGAGPNSEPSLRCPEVDLLQPRAARSLTRDAALRTSFVEAVRACAERLRGTGIDLARYGSVAAADDVEDLRIAIGLDRWSIASSYGTQSRALFNYLQQHPARVQAADLDSPWFPHIDELTGGVLATRSALDTLFDACASQPACHRDHPDLKTTWAAALHRLRTHPLAGSAVNSSGDPTEVLVDDGTLLRMARFALGGDGPANLAELPSIIAAAADGQLTPDLARWVAQDPTFCAGYRPLCAGQDGFSLGVYLTTFCAEQLPFVDPTALAAAIDDDPTYQAVFGGSPYRAACAAWTVPPAETSPAQVRTAIPVLVLSGQFDSYSPFSVSQAEAARLDRAWALQDPGSTHNVTGFSPCSISVRNAWTWAPTAPPDASACRSAKVIPLR